MNTKGHNHIQGGVEKQKGCCCSDIEPIEVVYHQFLCIYYKIMLIVQFLLNYVVKYSFTFPVVYCSKKEFSATEFWILRLNHTRLW